MLAGPPGLEPGIGVLETPVLPIILRAPLLGSETCVFCVEKLTSESRYIGLLFQLGFGVYGVFPALRAVLVASQFLLEGFALVHGIVLIFADLAAQRNDDAGILLSHNKKG